MNDFTFVTKRIAIVEAPSREISHVIQNGSTVVVLIRRNIVWSTKKAKTKKTETEQKNTKKDVNHFVLQEKQKIKTNTERVTNNRSAEITQDVAKRLRLTDDKNKRFNCELKFSSKNK